MFYRTARGNSPVTDFLEQLSDKESAKVTWTLNLVETLPVIPGRYMKKLKNTSGIWEVRISFGGNIFRILCFFDSDDVIVLNHAFCKKTQKTPRKDIRLAEEKKRDYLRRKYP